MIAHSYKGGSRIMIKFRDLSFLLKTAAIGGILFLGFTILDLLLIIGGYSVTIGR